MGLNDFKFYSKGTYLPSEFRARLEMLGAIHAGDLVIQEYIKKSIKWVEPYNDQENVIRWEKCEDGLFQPIVSTRPYN